ncbi:MAG: rhodanese-like domain-containing protein [Pseudomonadota bacterium]
MQSEPASLKTVKDLSPDEAYQLLQADSRALLVDVRSTMEYLFVGHPVGAVHIPWIDEPGWKANPDFITDVRKLSLGANEEQTDACPPIILICRSGQRSQEAGKALLAAGFSNISHVEEGFEGKLNEQHQRSTLNGWRFRGLPWEQC